MSSIISDLQNRYTVKQYDASKKISKDDMKVIEEALRLSVSSINSQPWKFIIIESDEAKQRFSDTFANKFQFNQKHAKDASAIILFCHNPYYTKNDYQKVIDADFAVGRINPDISPERNRDEKLGAYVFAELNTDNFGFNGNWTKAQTYIAFGNIIHTLARMNIGSTSMEGIDIDLVKQSFSDELGGFECHVALAIGYSKKEEDYNAKLPKSRLPEKEVIINL
ncbi:NAD(P)H-dependent oxidoreductase [Paraphotobacterium marinum]|uniref:NAD(P)H-dependent oxidoreductase n=1 Tax=Paraphotobacterium marinum TaxID=1755811 RepID=A0A220VBC8_9GAMM|nr:NAD(P)H-dependent oxidoreductase [Paraphotobacterium marinum]ASK77639.1 NAD(P)H-dependent oxidoreductase [Paraphotobacterium marinum]